MDSNPDKSVTPTEPTEPTEPTAPTAPQGQKRAGWGRERIGFGLLWLAFVGYAFLGAPPDDPQTLDLITRLSTGQWQGINPLVVALFNLMGLWPVAFAALLLWDGHLRRSAARPSGKAAVAPAKGGNSEKGGSSEGVGESVPAWPFVAASFGLGAFAIVPYLVLRSPASQLQKLNVSSPSALLRILNSPWLWAGLALGAILLLTYGLTQGNWEDFVQQWQTHRFIHVMTLDFCLLTLLFPFLAQTDLRRRG